LLRGGVAILSPLLVSGKLSGKFTNYSFRLHQLALPLGLTYRLIWTTISTPNSQERRKKEMAVKFELFKDAKGEFRWRLIASNGQTIATGGEGYKSKDSAKAGIESVKKNAAAAPIEEK
jgi:uncharacterized protein YegP (UPF0339 family)